MTMPPVSPNDVAHESDPCEAASGAMLDLFASLAHDLRSPLGVVSETVAELGTSFEAELTDEHRILIGLAQRSLRRLTRMAESLSLMVAIDSGGFELARRPVDLFSVLSGAMDAASGIEPRREVRVSRELPEAPCLAEIDTTRLSHALVEVAINAIRYARASVRVRAHVEPGFARIFVEDDGPGVAAGPKATLFRRVAPRVLRSGLGIGLSLAHDVVVAHGGSITLEASTLVPSRPGAPGACFLVSIPRAATL
jgi:signal transduction histidine kinase